MPFACNLMARRRYVRQHLFLSFAETVSEATKVNVTCRKSKNADTSTKYFSPAPLNSSHSDFLKVTLSIRFLNDTASVLFLFEWRLYSSSFETRFARSKLASRRSLVQCSIRSAADSKVLQKVVIKKRRCEEQTKTP